MENDLSIKVSGQNVNYSDSRKHTLPIIFIHGFPFNKSSWDPQYEFLKETQRVIIYDLPGFGKSAELAGETSISSLADHLIHFMDSLKIEKAIVCGLSMGGYILLNAMERYGERFEAIVLADTQCLADNEEAAKKRFDAIKAIQENGLTEFTEGFLKNAFSKNAQETQTIIVERIRTVILSNSSLAITTALKAMAERKETCSALEKITVPALIICGEEDKLTPVSLSEFLFDQIPNSEIHIIPEAGHLSNLEKSDDFNDRLFNFISDIII